MNHTTRKPSSLELPQRALLLPPFDGPDGGELEREAPALDSAVSEATRWMRQLGARVRSGDASIESALLATYFYGDRRGQLRFVDATLREIILRDDAKSRKPVG